MIKMIFTLLCPMADRIHNMEGSGKNLRRVRTSCHVHSLHIEPSPEKIQKVEKEPIRFRVKVMAKLGVDFKTFCICNTQLRFIHAKFLVNYQIRLIILIFYN